MQRIRTSAKGTIDIGSREDILAATTESYDVVVTVDIEPIDARPIRAYHWVNMSDGYSGDRGHYTRAMFDQAADVVANALRAGYHVAIHCYVGRSRSVAVAIAAIGRVQHLSFEQARNLVREQRPQSQMKPLLAQHARAYIER